MTPRLRDAGSRAAAPGMGVRIAAAFAAALASASAGAADVHVEDAWARASAGAARNGAAYVTLVNRGADAALIGAESPAAARAELHMHIMDGGMARMRPAGGVPLPAGARVTLAPGGVHIMLMDLHAPLLEGAWFPMTLRFDDGDSRETKFAVGGVAAAAPPAAASRERGGHAENNGEMQ